VDELLAIGGLEFPSIQGELSKQKEMEDEMWGKAVTSARERADKMLKPLGLRIDSVFGISPVQFSQIEGDIFGPVEKVVVTRAVPPLQPEAASHYRFAPVTVSQRVHVIYLISPAK